MSRQQQSFDDEDEWRHHSFFPSVHNSMERQQQQQDDEVELDEFAIPIPNSSKHRRQRSNNLPVDEERMPLSPPYRESRSRKRSIKDSTQREIKDQTYAQQLHDEEIARYLAEQQARKERRKSRRETVSERMATPEVRRQLRQFKKQPAYFVWTVSLVQIIMMIVTLGMNQAYTGSLIQLNPFNIMLGPSPYTLIRAGARFVPCMKEGTTLAGREFQCPAGLSSNNDGVCSLEELCGGASNQWWRFIAPIFLHGGLIHLITNVAAQLVIIRFMEHDFGWWRIGSIYMLCGTWGFIFGGNFAPEMTPSVGASGAIFGFLACLLIDLIQNWYIVVSPWKELSKLLLEIGFMFIIEILPGIDNFSHLGGFFMGILSGLVFMPSLHFGRWDKRRKLFLKVAAMPVILIMFIVLLVTFYQNDPESVCGWCKNLDCFGIKSLCSLNLQLT